jgi:uncharacterized protein (DUF427 family)
VSTYLPKVTKLNEESIVCEGDKPVVFYKDYDSVEMQYLASECISSVQPINDKLIYQDSKQHLNIGFMD